MPITYQSLCQHQKYNSEKNNNGNLSKSDPSLPP